MIPLVVATACLVWVAGACGSSTTSSSADTTGASTATTAEATTVEPTTPPTVTTAPSPRSTVAPTTTDPAAGSTSTTASTEVPTTVAETTTTVAPFSGTLVPPAEPASLIGATILTRQIVSPGRVPVDGDPTLLINGAVTNLVSFGGGCLDDDCVTAVEELVDAAAVADGSWPSASYLVLETLLERDASGLPTWTIVDVVTVTGTPPDVTWSLFAEGCTFTGLPDTVVPAAALIDWSADPLTVQAAWGYDATAGGFVELAVDPSWTCVPLGD